MNSNKTASFLSDKRDDEIAHKISSLSPDVQVLIERYVTRLLESEKHI